MKQEEVELQLEDASTDSNAIVAGEIVIGILDGLDEQGKPLVDFQENPSSNSLVAISTMAINQQQSGRQVALLFAEGDLLKPVIIGLIHNPLYEMLESFEFSTEQSQSAEKDQLRHDESVVPNNNDVRLDGKRVVLEGKEEVVLKCGDASITLTKAGKILIRGKYLLNRSSGVNRIMGGSVQIN